MHTAEEVRAIAAAWVDDDPKLHEMLLAYADLLEAMDEGEELAYPDWQRIIRTIRQRAAEIAARRKR